MAKILYIEDDEKSSLLVKQLLEFEGHTVILSQNGEDGIADTLFHRPDLILLDLNMPKADGLRVAGALGQFPSTQRARIVVVTAHAIKGTEEIVRQVGVDGYITKPINPDSFSDQVAAFLKNGDAVTRNRREG